MNKATQRTKITATLALLLALTLMTGSAAAFAGGDGSSGNPYQISTCSEFQSISNNGHYILINDIDCSGADLSGTISNNQFSGDLDGQNYIISNFEVTSSPIFSESSFDTANANLKNIVFSNIQSIGSANSLISAQMDGWEVRNLVIRDSTFTASGDINLVAERFRAASIIEGYEIINVDVTSSGDIAGVGAGIVGGTIKDVTITGSSFQGSGKVAGVSGNGGSSTNILIENSYFSTDSSFTGLSGVNLEGGTVDNAVLSNVDIEHKADSAETAGIIAGYSCGTITNSALRNVDIIAGSTTTSYLGVDAGGSTCTIEDSYVAGSSTISGNIASDYIGGSNPSLTDVYYDSQTIQTGSSTGATGLLNSEMTGSSAETNMNFDFTNIWKTVASEYPVLRTNIINPPSITNVKPVDGSTRDQGISFDFETEVDTSVDESATVEIIVEDPSGTNSTILSESQNADSIITYTQTQTYNTTGTYKWWTNAVTATKDVTESGGSFTVEEYTKPDVEITNPEDGGSLNFSSYQYKYTEDRIFNITAFNSDVSWTLKEEYYFDGSFHGEKSIASGTVTGSGSASSGNEVQITDNPTGDWEFVNRQYPRRFHIEYSTPETSSTSSTVNWTTKTVDIAPNINNFDVTPSIADADVGDQFDLAVDGNVNTDEIDSITYSMSITGNNDPSDIVVDQGNIDFQNSNSFNDQVINAFKYKESYNGENVEISVTVEDTAGRTDSSSVSEITKTPPDSFSLFDPDNGAVELIPEGDTDTTVDFSYGVETAQHSGTLELVVDGNTENTHQVAANTNYNNLSHQMTLTENTYTWYLKFTDDTTGETYTSNQFTFEVTEEPFALTLQDPNNGETINLLDQSSTDIDHNFQIDAQATNKNYYYQFILENQSSGNVLVERNSSDLNTGVESFTENVQDLGAKDYEWTVNIFFSSNDQYQESKTSSYTIVENEKFDASLNNPFDGKQIEIGSNESSADFNASYNVQTYKDSVQAELYLDNSLVDNRSISDQSDQTVDIALQDVSIGQHEVKLEVEDESARTFSATNGFRIAQEDQANVTLNELSTEPGFDEITPSTEEVNIYFEAENQTEIEYVDVDVLVNGTLEHTIRVPKDELIIGSISLLETIDLERDLGYNYNQLKNSDISIRATVVDGLQKSYRWGRSFAFGIQDPLPVQETPTDGKKWNESSGEPEEHRLSYNIEMANHEVLYRVYVNNTRVDFGTATETGDTFEGETFVNVVEDLGYSQFGEFNWHVNITEEITDYETSTGDDTFYILNASETDVILNFNNPEKNQPYILKNNIDKKTVPFGFSYESDVAGTVKLKLKGEIEATLYNEEVEAGSDTEIFNEQLPKGEYTATLTYNKEGGSTVKEQRFFTVRKEKNVPEDRVFVDTPDTGKQLFQTQQTSFSWGVKSSGGNGETWYEIRNSDGNIAENYTENYTDFNEVAIYGRNIGTLGLGVGEYTAQAFFKRDGDTVQESNNVSFTVVDFDKPELRQINSIENNTVYKEGEPINFSVESKTFESPATATIKYRHVDDYESFNIAKRDYEEFETATLEGVKRFDPGQYAWYVQYDVNPTFTTKPRYFTVESNDIPEPEFSLNSPEQNQTIEIPSGDNSTNVTFDYDTEVFTSSDAEVNLLLSNREDGLTNFKQRATDIQTEADEVQIYLKELDLGEGGYLYKVEVVYTNSTHTSDSVGFSVDDPITKEEPEAPQPDEGVKKSNFLNSTIEYVAGFLGVGFGGLGSMVQIVIASIITVVAGGLINNWTESAEIGLMSMMVSIFIFVVAGWLPAWVGIILFMLSAAVFIYALRKVHGGR